MCSTQAQDWQMQFSTLVECNRYMLEKEVACDVTFQVGKEEEPREEVRAHRYILMARSPVFFAMFCGDMRVAHGETVVVDDVTSSAFKLLLKYLYCEDLELDEDSVLPILYASKKYLLPALTTKCVQYLEANLTPDNVCLFYEHSILYDITSLQKRCENFIQTRTNDIIQAPSFLEVPHMAVKRILQFRKLAAEELMLFQMCNSWAKEECSRQEVEPNMANRRQVLGDVMYLLHLPSLPLKDFANVVSKADLLTAEEKCAIYDYIASDDTTEVVDKLKFPTRRRSKPKPSILRRFPNFSKCNVYSGDCNILKVQCDHNVILKGIGVSGSLNHDPLTEVQIVVKQERTVLANRSVAVCDDRSGDAIQIMLPDTVLLKPGIWYTVIATFHFFGDTDQGCCRRGKGGAKMATCDGVSFEFDRADAAGHVIDLLFWKH